jgi:two-component system LytT family response regulator
MITLRVLVVDDEPLARQVAVNLLRADPEIETIEECSDGTEAQSAMTRVAPDIAILDIEMPGRSGLQVAAANLDAAGPVVIFTTAFSQYALEAFDVAAIDYVLKPFSDERFREALARAKRRVRERRIGDIARQLAGTPTDRQPAPSVSTDAPSDYLHRLALKQGERGVVLKMEEVVWIEAEDYYVRVHSSRGRHLIRASLASLEARLDPRMFARVHRTAIVNIDHVRETDERDGLSLVLTDGSRVPVSRARKARVDALLAPRLR